MARAAQGDRINWRLELEWVYLNLDRVNGYTSAPPTPGSVAFLKWARENQSDFYQQLRPIIAKASQTTRVQGMEEDEEPVLELIEHARKILDRKRVEEGSHAADGE